MGGESEPRPTHLWRDSALIALALTAVVFMLGYLRTKSYFGALGLGWNSIQFAPHEYMGSAWSFLLAPAIVLALLVFLDQAITGRKTNKNGPEYFQAISAPLMVFLAAFWSLVLAWEDLGDESKILRPGMTMQDVVILVGATILTIVVLLVHTRSNLRDDPFLGRTNMAKVYQVSIAFVMLLAASTAHGGNAANDLRWGCVAHESVAFEPLPPGLESNATYWLLLQHDGFFFVRDASLHGSKAGYVAVHESSVETAHVTREPARSCPNA